MASISFFLPFKQKGAHYGDNDARLVTLLRTLKNCFGDLAESKFIICSHPDDLTAAINVGTAFPGIPLDIIDENELIDGITENKALRPWQKQQALKLSSFKRCTSEFVFFLDPDILFVERFSTVDVARAGRSLISLTHAPEDSIPWWGASSSLLMMPLPKGPLFMGVTPELLKASILSDLSEHIERIYGCRLIDALSLNASRHWTEFTLYHTFLNTVSKIEHHHLTDSRERRLLRDESIWRNLPNPDLRLSSLLNPETRNGICAVIQSSAFPNYADITQQVQHLLYLQQNPPARKAE